MQVNIHHAKSQITKLVAAAEAGEDVIIARNGKPAVKLVPVQPGSFRLGMMNGLIEDIPDFLEPLSQDELAAWEGGR